MFRGMSNIMKTYYKQEGFQKDTTATTTSEEWPRILSRNFKCMLKGCWKRMENNQLPHLVLFDSLIKLIEIFRSCFIQNSHKV
jgi:hypothetical protein